MMKKVKIALLMVGMATFMWGCGGGNADADKFCSCFEKFESGEKDACEEDMEALEDAFKEDEARYESFKAAAMAKCPDAKRYIDRMN